jgi:arabinofuranan 3-O-arabinosyltransferase
LMTIDGQPVGIRVGSTLNQFLNGATVPFSACAPVALAPGQHVLNTNPALDGLVDEVRLDTGSAAPTPSTPGATIQVVSQASTSMHATIDAPLGAYVITGQAYAAGWKATVNGRSLGPALSVNAMTGWWVPAGHQLNLVVWYGPQRVYQVGLDLSGASVLVCVWLLWRSRSKRPSA